MQERELRKLRDDLYMALKYFGKPTGEKRLSDAIDKVNVAIERYTEEKGTENKR